MASVSYPSFSDAQPSVEKLFAILTGNADRDVRLALQHGWVVQGFLQGALIPPKSELPEPNKVSRAMMASNVSGKRGETISHEQAVAMLGALRQRGKRDNDESSTLRAQGFLGDLFGKDLQKEVARLLLPILMRWLDQWLSGEGV